MSQRITIDTLCDLDHASEIPGLTYTISIAGPGETPATYAIDLCDACQKSYLDLRAETIEHGRELANQPGKPRRRRESVDTGTVYTCPLDGCEHTTPTASGISTHARKVHGVTISELRGEADRPCPVDGCDRLFTNRQGTIMHVRTQHGWTPDQWEGLAP